MTTVPSEGQAAQGQQAAEESGRLVRAIAEGNREAERELVLRYMPPVRAMLLARSRNAELTSDLQQDVMLETICALRRGQLGNAEKLPVFILGIARNLLNNYFRLSRRTEPLELPEELPDLSIGTTAERLEEQDREACALRAIATLEEMDRLILQMTLVDGLKPGAIAARLRLNPEVVRQRKLRATRRVMEMVRGESQSGPDDHIGTGRER